MDAIRATRCVSGRAPADSSRSSHRRAWTAWEPALRDRLPGALAEARAALARACLFHEYVQWMAAEQWAAARREATVLGVRLLGDLAFMTSIEMSTLVPDARAGSWRSLDAS